MLLQSKQKIIATYSYCTHSTIFRLSHCLQIRSKRNSLNNIKPEHVLKSIMLSAIYGAQAEEGSFAKVWLEERSKFIRSWGNKLSKADIDKSVAAESIWNNPLQLPRLKFVHCFYWQIHAGISGRSATHMGHARCQLRGARHLQSSFYRIDESGSYRTISIRVRTLHTCWYISMRRFNSQFRNLFYTIESIRLQLG